jgi:23S rRNA (adenine2503-C2)-methyltransferase
MEIPALSAYMDALMTAFMSIPGHIDPVPVPRPAKAADADARVNLVGLAKAEIQTALGAAGLDERQAKLRAKQLWHQIYNRGATDFAAMSDIAKPHRIGLDRRHPQMAAAHARRP